MAYFDSPKNRALWQKELNSLRKEKERRAEALKNGIDLALEEMEAKQEKKVEKTVDVVRERTSYKELLREEAMELRNKKTAFKERTVQKEKSFEKADLGLSV